MLALTVCTLVLLAAGEFFLHQQGIATGFTFSCNRLRIDGKFTLGIAIATIKRLTITAVTLHQMTRAAFRTQPGLLLRFSRRAVLRLNMMTFRVMAAANEHPVAPLAQNEFMLAFRAGNTERFDDVAVILVQRFDVIAVRISTATQKGTVFSMAHQQSRPALRAGRLLLNLVGKQIRVNFTGHNTSGLGFSDVVISEGSRPRHHKAALPSGCRRFHYPAH